MSKKLQKKQAIREEAEELLTRSNCSEEQQEQESLPESTSPLTPKASVVNKSQTVPKVQGKQKVSTKKGAVKK